MNRSNWTALWEKLGLVGAYPVKRVEKAKIRWGSHTEELENRALLSAATHHVDATAADMNVVDRAKTPVIYPTIAGTWNVTITGGQLSGGGTAVITVTQKKPTSVPAINSVVTLTGVPVIHSSGKFDKVDHSVISGTAKVNIPGFGAHTVTLKITFAPGNNPTSFSGTVSIGKSAPLVTFTGALSTPT
jgi:hypothetical protein